jgi:peptidyl-tRNA hydrolase, PTH2 family
MVEHKQVIILRKDLNMRKGKMAAQAAHASMAAILNQGMYDDSIFTLVLDERIKPWLSGKFKKIVVSVNSENELKQVYEQAKAAGLITAYIVDSGLTEFGGVPTPTAVAVGPDTEEKVNAICGNLSLL